MKFLISLFHSCCEKCHRVEDEFDPVLNFRVKLLVATTLITGLLMWTYAYVSFHYVNDETIKYVGILYALIHLMAPLVYRSTGSLVLATYTMLIPGGAFQTHFSVLTGGFYTSTLIWVGILPLIAGILTNKKHTLIWSGIVSTIILAVFILDTQMGIIPNLLDERGLLITQLLITYGMVLLNCFFTLFLLEIYQIKTNELQAKAINKENLLHVVVHDISNPLTVVYSAVSSLKRSFQKGNTDQEKIIARLEKVDSNINNTMKIINSVREVEAFQSGKKALQLKPVNLSECVDNAIAMLKERALSKGITFNKKFDDEVMILGNSTIVEQQVITNILTNAMKFSSKGSSIDIDLEESVDGIVLRIRDYGEGMPNYIMSTLFDPLAKTSRKGTSGEVGTGFGMPIAKRFMKLLSGDIQVASVEKSVDPNNSGTTFSLTFKKGEEEIQIEPPASSLSTSA